MPEKSLLTQKKQRNITTHPSQRRKMNLEQLTTHRQSGLLNRTEIHIGEVKDLKFHCDL